MIAFRKVSEPHGWFGNMSPHPVEYGGLEWRTTEALFQAMRFEDYSIREEIRAEKSPMSAKMVAKKHADSLTVVPRSDDDLRNMRLVLRLKVDQHPALMKALLDTGDEEIVEDTTKRRDEYWGARLVDGKWVGENVLGKMWMELRAKVREERSEDAPYDPADDDTPHSVDCTCSWCEKLREHDSQ